MEGYQPLRSINYKPGMFSPRPRDRFDVLSALFVAAGLTLSALAIFYSKADYTLYAHIGIGFMLVGALFYGIGMGAHWYRKKNETSASAAVEKQLTLDVSNNLTKNNFLTALALTCQICGLMMVGGAGEKASGILSGVGLAILVSGIILLVCGIILAKVADYFSTQLETACAAAQPAVA